MASIIYISLVKTDITIYGANESLLKDFTRNPNSITEYQIRELAEKPRLSLIDSTILHLYLLKNNPNELSMKTLKKNLPKLKKLKDKEVEQLVDLIELRMELLEDMPKKLPKNLAENLLLVELLNCPESQKIKNLKDERDALRRRVNNLKDELDRLREIADINNLISLRNRIDSLRIENEKLRNQLLMSSSATNLINDISKLSKELRECQQTLNDVLTSTDTIIGEPPMAIPVRY